MYIYTYIYISSAQAVPATVLGTGYQEANNSTTNNEQLSNSAKQPTRQPANHHQETNKRTNNPATQQSTKSTNNQLTIDETNSKNQPKINQNLSKIGPWGPLGGIWGPSRRQEQPRPPQKRRPAKLRNPTWTWCQVEPKIHSKSIKIQSNMQSKNQLICS